MKQSVWILLLCSFALMACQLTNLFFPGPATSSQTSTKSQATATVAVKVSVVAPPSVTTATAKETIPIRSTASTAASAVSQLNQGESAEITARTSANDWFQVNVFSGLFLTQGWVLASQVTVEGSLDQIPVVQPPTPAPSKASPSSSSRSSSPTPARKTYP
jgi:uncharacterized protein YgiM (DUF1202 family)